jgi:hypothetical protein
MESDTDYALPVAGQVCCLFAVFAAYKLLCSQGRKEWKD